MTRILGLIVSPRIFEPRGGERSGLLRDPGLLHSVPSVKSLGLEVHTGWRRVRVLGAPYKMFCHVRA